MWILAAQAEAVGIIELVKQFGLMASTVAFFIWRDWKREDRMTTRVAQLEDQQHNIILPLLQQTTQVIARNTLVMEQVQRELEAHRKTNFHS